MQTCKLCTHRERAAIDAALVQGQPLRDIAGQFQVSRSALQRHKAEHLPPLLLQAKDAAAKLSAERLLQDLVGLQARALALLAKAEGVNDLRVALAGVREARECVEAAAKLLEQTDMEQRIAALEEKAKR